MREDHAFTLHHTYTGHGCAICGQGALEHYQDHFLLNGEKIPMKDGRPTWIVAHEAGLKCIRCGKTVTPVGPVWDQRKMLDKFIGEHAKCQ